MSLPPSHTHPYVKSIPTLKKTADRQPLPHQPRGRPPPLPAPRRLRPLRGRGQQYLRINEAGITRLASALQRAQDKGELRADVAVRQMAQMLMGLVLGMQTLLDLAMPFDLPGMARTLLLMSPPGNMK